jgi:hypothetical protein
VRIDIFAWMEGIFGERRSSVEPLDCLNSVEWFGE